MNLSDLLPSKGTLNCDATTSSVKQALNEMSHAPDDESIQKSLEWLIAVGTPHRYGKMYGLPGVARAIEWLCLQLFKTTDIQPVTLDRMHGLKLWRNSLSENPDLRTAQLIERTRFRAVRNFLPSVTLAGHSLPLFANIELDPLIGYVDD